MSLLQTVPSHDDIESLFVNNENLAMVAAYLNRFNPIRIMRMQDMEIRHSSILAWLLDPRETHELADLFLRAFLAEALRGQSHMGSPTALEISQANLMDVEIRREKQNIDILVLSRSNGWAFIIENKFRSRQAKGQLQKYLEQVELGLGKKSLIIRGIFLTLLDEEVNHSSYVPLRYASICHFFIQLLSQVQAKISKEAHLFMTQYIDVLRDATGTNEEQEKMEELARQLYRSHKKALDFILRHGSSTEFVIATEVIFGADLSYGDLTKNDKLMFNRHNNTQFSFVPVSWVNALGGGKHLDIWQGCENWGAKYPLICWFQLKEGKDGVSDQITLHAEVGPLKNHDHRRSLIESIKTAAEEKKLKNVCFQKDATKRGKQYSKFLKSNSVSVEDTHDGEEIESAMRTLLKGFLPTLDAIGVFIPTFTSEIGIEDVGS
jgi:hypothetical protein